MFQSSLYIYIYTCILICPDLEIWWFFKTSSSCHHRFFRSGMSFWLARNHRKKVAAKLRATWEEWSACSESCGTRGWELWKPDGCHRVNWWVGSTPSHQSPAWGHCLCGAGVRVVFFSTQHIVHTYYLELGEMLAHAAWSAAGESLSRLGFTKNEGKSTFFCLFLGERNKIQAEHGPKRNRL